MIADASANVRAHSNKRSTASFALLVILLVAAGLRFPELGRRGYLLDEAWTAEIATGRGSQHLALETGKVLPPPEIFRLSDAPPWWAVWTHMQVTHPPLYFLLERLWMNALGQGDGIERSLSVIFSLVAIAFLFDAARVHNGLGVAVWAALLMTFATPQIDYARQNRNYTMELAMALAAADALVRIERFGVSRWRVAGLAAATLATLLTHYFCIGFLGALGIYALLRLRGQARIAAASAMVTAGIAFLLCWGPFMWQQRTLFSVHDVSTTFLDESDPAHVARSLHRALLLPFDMLAEPKESVLNDAVANGGTQVQSKLSISASSIAGVLAVAASVLFVLPLLMLRRRPDLMLWWLCLVCTIGLVLGMDLARETRHLAFIRYVLPAAPPVYVLIPAVVSGARLRWVRQALPAAALGISLLAIPEAYQTAITDPHLIANDLQQVMQPNDFFVFIATGNDRWEAFAHFLVLDRYIGRFPGPIAVEEDVASPAVLQRALAGPMTFANTEHEDARLMLPGMVRLGFRQYFGRGEIWLMGPPATRSPGH